MIEDVTPRTERIPQQFSHKNGATGIAKVTVAVGELGQIEKWYCGLLHSSGAAMTDNQLASEGLRFEAGPHVLEFLTPRDPASPLIEWLRRFGPSPYSAVLRGGDVNACRLDIQLTHGANLLLE